MAGPYVFCAVKTGAGGIVAWDVSSDTQAAILLSAGSNTHSDHSLYVSNDGTTLYSRGFAGVGKVNTSTLAAAMVPNSSGYAIPSLGNTNIACSPDGSEFYVASPVSTNSVGVATVTLFAVNGTTGVVRTSVSLGALGTGDQRQVGMAVSPDGTLIFLNGPITAYRTSDLSAAYTTSVGGISHYGSVMGFSPDGSLTYYYDQTVGKIGTFRTSDGVSVANVSIASVDDFALTTNGLNGYTSTIGGSSVILFNTTPLATVRSVSLAPSWAMGGVSITLDGTAVYTANANFGAASQIAKIPLPAFTTPAKFAFTGTAAGASIAWLVGRPFVGPPPVTPPSTPTGLKWNTPLRPNGSPYCQGNKLSLSWLPLTGASAYRLRRDGNIVYDGPLNVFDDYGAMVGISYSYTISAYNGSGESAQSSPLVLTPCSLQAFAKRCVLRVGDWQERCPIRSQ